MHKKARNVLAKGALFSSVISTNITGQFNQNNLELNDVFENAINWFIVLVIAATVIMLIWGGAKYMTAGDDTDKIEGARTTITNAVIGAIVVVITFAIVFVINALTGAQIQIGLPF